MNILTTVPASYFPFNKLVYIMESFHYSSIAYGNIRISGGGKSGQLEFQNSSGDWGAVCKDGFDDDAGDVACRQLGYTQSSDIYTYTQYVADHYCYV